MKKIILAVFSIILLGAGCNSANPNLVGTPAPEKPQSVEPVPGQGEVNGPAIGETKSFTMTARQWAFEPSTITVNKGDHVKIAITSKDVTHGFALPDFNVNTTLEPGKTTTVEFDADKIGSFGFFCSIQCGEGHPTMKGKLVVK